MIDTAGAKRCFDEMVAALGRDDWTAARGWYARMSLRSGMDDMLGEGFADEAMVSAGFATLVDVEELEPAG